MSAGKDPALLATSSNLLPSPLTPDIPPHMQPHQFARHVSKGVSCYAIGIVFVQLAALMTFFFLAATRWFLTHDDYPLLRYDLGYSTRAHSLNCDVLIYGDSSAMMGLDPAIIQERTHLTTCNISEASYVHRMAGSFYPLDRYLASNKKPIVLLTSWSPFDFHPYLNAETDGQPEGLEYSVLYEPHRRADIFLHHPYWWLKFSIWAGNRIFEDLATRLVYRHANSFRGVPRDDRAGFTQFQLPPQATCSTFLPTVYRTYEDSKASFDAFRDRYTAKGMIVVTNVSPTAICAPNHPALEAMTRGIADNTLQFWQPQMFNERSVHLTPEGSTRYSQQASDQILELLHRRDATPSAGEPSR